MSLKRFVKKNVVLKIVSNEIIWNLSVLFVRLGRALYHTRKEYEGSAKFSGLFQDCTVLNGSFKGMRYPSLISFGSEIYPKLIGSYEHEIYETIEYFCTQQYSEVIDIGCAEGYYAIGFALRMPTSRIFAYDISCEARELCSGMAALNKVEDRVAIKSYCDAEELAGFEITKKGLIICDTDGYEGKLFNERNIKKLEKFDLLIETHDFIDKNISNNLKQLFSGSHHIKIIKSISDSKKARDYKFLNGNLSFSDRKVLYAERRPEIQEWIVCLSKNVN